MAPGVVAGFAGVLEVGLDSELRPVGDMAAAWPLGTLVLILRDDDVGRSRASGGERAGKPMTCSRKGTE